MSESKGIYFFNGKDITMNFCIQVRAVVDIIKEERKIDFVEALGQFYRACEIKSVKDNSLI